MLKSNYYMLGTVLGRGESAGNKPDRIPAFVKLTFRRVQETKMIGNERGRGRE